MLRRGLSPATALRRPLVRGVASSAPLMRRDDDRLPRGHVRPSRPQRRTPSPFDQLGGQPGFGGFQGAGFPGAGFPGAGGWNAFGPGMGQPRTQVVVPRDPGGVLADTHGAYELLAHDTLVVVRQLEMLNVFLGFEQANRYAIHSPEGEVVGYLAEEDKGILSTMTRQFLHTHRPFRSVVMDRTGKPILWIRRPFAFINSRIYVHAGENDGEIVGETQQQWHPWRRRYNLFQHRPDDVYSQFGRIDGGFLAWDFWIKDRDDRLIGTINRNFAGLGRELFTDTGQYVIRFDAAGTELDLAAGDKVNVQGQTLILPERHEGGLTLDQRAMTLATAVSIDFDYFSRHSGSGGMGFPFILFGGGDGSSEARRSGSDDTASAAGAAGAAGAEGAMGYPSEMTDDEIYGRAPSGPQRDASPGERGQEGWDNGREPYPGSSEYEEVMEDPWAQQQSDEGLFGGSGDGGDWGDWS